MQSRLGAVRAAAVLAVVVAAGAAGCSSGGTTGKAASSTPATKMTAAQELAATLKNTQQLKSFSASMSIKISGIPGASGSSNMSMSGTVQGQRQPSLLEEFDASSFEVAGQNLGSMTEIVTPKAFYMKMPMMTAELHKQWMELPFSAPGDTATARVR